MTLPTLILSLLCLALAIAAWCLRDSAKASIELAAFWRNLYTDRADSADRWMTACIESRERESELARELEAYRSEDTRP